MNKLSADFEHELPMYFWRTNSPKMHPLATNEVYFLSRFDWIFGVLPFLYSWVPSAPLPGHAYVASHCSDCFQLELCILYLVWNYSRVQSPNTGDIIATKIEGHICCPLWTKLHPVRSQCEWDIAVCNIIFHLRILLQFEDFGNKARIVELKS